MTLKDWTLALYEEHGTLTPEIVKNAARPEDSPAHAYVFNDVDQLTHEAQHGDVLASQIKGNVLLESRLYWEALTTSARTVDVDYITIWQDRVR